MTLIHHTTQTVKFSKAKLNITFQDSLSISKDNLKVSPSKITKFKDPSFRVNQQVLWLDVSMTDSHRVNISQAAKQLVHVELKQTLRN